MKTHPSHDVRFSFDASSYDEICNNCGATDGCFGGDALARPCPDQKEQVMSMKHEVAAGKDWIEPLFDRVVVELPPLKDKTKGGLYIPEAYLDRHKQFDPRQIKPLVGKVIAVGPGGLAPNGDHLKMMVAVGDVVIMHNSPTVGIKHTMNGKDVLIIGQYDLIAKVSSELLDDALAGS